MSRPSTEEGLPADAGAAHEPLFQGTPAAKQLAAIDVARACRVALRRLRCHVQAYVGTHHIHAELRVRGPSLRWRTLHALHRPVGATGTSGLAAALAALDAALTELRSVAATEVGADFGGGRCDVILADAWVVYDVIAVDLAMLAPALADEAVAAALGEVLGVPADSLVVRWQRRRDGRGVFGMAVARDDLVQVRQTVMAHRLRLCRATGEFIAILNGQQSTVPTGRAVVAVVREAGTQLAALVGGEVALARFEPGLAEASSLPDIARRALSACGLEFTPAVDYCIDAGRSAPAAEVPVNAGWHWLPIPPWVPATRALDTP